MEILTNFGDAEERLSEWIHSALNCDISFGIPDAVQAENSRVNFYLLDLLHAPRPHTGNLRPPSQISLRYLATVNARVPGDERRLASELLFEAIENPALEIESDPVPLQLWLALGVPPRPAIIFRIALIRVREQLRAPMVRKVVVSSAPIMEIIGRVLGPGETPVMDAVVELPSVKRSARTDHNGQFSLSTVPSEPREVELVVKARGREMSIRTSAHHHTEKFVAIQFEGLEE